jgi:predicted phosphodiesterase
MNKTELMASYIERFPNHADLTIAKKAYKENVLVWKNLEAARSSVRSVRGKVGSYSSKNKTFHVEPTFNYNPYKLPESEEKIREPYILPLADNNILLISDLHIPYHSIDAITAALDYGKEQKVNTIIMLGDVMDFYGVSRFEKDPRKRSIKHEFDTTKAFLVILRQTFPDARIYWAFGNHDVRFEHFLMAKAPEIFDDPYFRLEERLRLNEERIHTINDKTIIKAGKLSLHHGHLFFRGFGAPVNPARGLFLKTKESAIVGHSHRVSEHSEISLGGDLITCWSMGCLSELQPEYNPVSNNYSHGFAHIKTSQNGNYSVRNFRILKGKIL